jgi:hypothetical protein
MYHFQHLKLNNKKNSEQSCQIILLGAKLQQQLQTTATHKWCLDRLGNVYPAHAPNRVVMLTRKDEHHRIGKAQVNGQACSQSSTEKSKSMTRETMIRYGMM